MGYDLKALNAEVEGFSMGAFSWPVILEFCSYLWPMAHDGGRWYRVTGIDPRFDGDYPPVLSNDGFEVNAEEARIMARLCRNFVAVQRTLPDENMASGLKGKATWKREDVAELLKKAMSDSKPGPWPLKIRVDFTDKIAAFADWADRSGGFTIH
jgi:hypothetical protein